MSRAAGTLIQPAEARAMERLLMRAVSDLLWDCLGSAIVLSIYKDEFRRRHDLEISDRRARAALGIGWGGTELA